jgi:hypothetical protein
MTFISRWTERVARIKEFVNTNSLVADLVGMNVGDRGTGERC